MIEEQNVDMVKSQNGQCFDHPPRILSITRTNPACGKFQMRIHPVVGWFSTSILPRLLQNSPQPNDPLFSENAIAKNAVLKGDLGSLPTSTALTMQLFEFT